MFNKKKIAELERALSNARYEKASLEEKCERLEKQVEALSTAYDLLADKQYEVLQERYKGNLYMGTYPARPCIPNLQSIMQHYPYYPYLGNL